MNYNREDYYRGGNGWLWVIIIILGGLVLLGGAGGALVPSTGSGTVGQTVHTVHTVERVYVYPTPQNYVQVCMGVPGPCPNGFYVWSVQRQNEWLAANGGRR
jgi:hypothetical protein